MKKIEFRKCKICLNSTKNPTISINKNGLCKICDLYQKNFDKRILQKEFLFLKSLKNTGKKKYDVMVGISGGKDSTATLYSIKEMGFKPLAFTFDIGYYPKHIFPRAKKIAKTLNIDHIIIPIKKYIRKNDRISYQKTAEFYDRKYSSELAAEAMNLYQQGRKHYSPKCKLSLVFIRTCHLCRHTVIRAYYNEALKHGVKVIILGINEWAGLSQSRASKKYKISAIRKLQPFHNKPPVYIIHLPFLLQRKIKDTVEIIKKLGWKVPKGETIVETNANSCLFARAAENKARKLLGFPLDSTRLSREITVGFITKKQAKKALNKNHHYRYSVSKVLKMARII